MPDRMPPKLSGIISCVSGGLDEMAMYPSAAKIVFRQLGKEYFAIQTIDAHDKIWESPIFFRAAAGNRINE